MIVPSLFLLVVNWLLVASEGVVLHPWWVEAESVLMCLVVVVS